MSVRKLRVLVIDDSAMVRKLVQQRLSASGRLEVVAAAHSGEAAIRDLVLGAPDVLLIDENLPGMSGTTFLRKVMHRCPMPAVVFSGRCTAELRARALREGAVDVVAKPTALDTQPRFWSELEATLRRAARADIPALPKSAAPALVIGIAVSTGGPPVVRRVLRELPPGLPPIVIVQHMRESYLPAFASQLDADCALRVELGHDQMPLLPGRAVVAPPGHQSFVVGASGRLLLQLGPGAPVSGHTPSGDALLTSIACTAGGRSVGVVLTGMGADGAAGLLAIRRAGGRTVAQDEASCAVYGMPRAAAENGAARRVVPLEGIAQAIRQGVGG